MTKFQYPREQKNDIIKKKRAQNFHVGTLKVDNLYAEYVEKGMRDESFGEFLFIQERSNRVSQLNILET